MKTNPNFKNKKSTDADILYFFLKQMCFKNKVGRLKVTNTTGSFSSNSKGKVPRADLPCSTELFYPGNEKNFYI